MNWVAIGVGAGAGVVAVLISAGIMKLLGRENSKAANILYLIVFALTLVIGREFVEPRIQAKRVESALLDMPVYRTLQQHEPKAYEQIRSAVETSIANKLPQEQMWVVTRPVITEVVTRRLPHASDDVLIKYGAYIVSATSLLHAKGGQACFSYLNPTPGQALDYAALLGKEVAEQELNLVSELVTSAAGKKRAAVTEAEAKLDAMPLSASFYLSTVNPTLLPCKPRIRLISTSKSTVK